jgi:hypothetical protein
MGDSQLCAVPNNSGRRYRVLPGDRLNSVVGRMDLGSLPANRPPTLAEWKARAARRLGTEHLLEAVSNVSMVGAPGPPLALGNQSFAMGVAPGSIGLSAEDAANQTHFPPRFRDTAVATIVSTADLTRLVPVPDAATLMCSTLPSLRRAEREAAELLAAIQRDLAFQLQEAGVTFDRSAFDDLRSRGRTMDDPKSTFAERKQLQFKSHKRHVLPDSIEATRSLAPHAAGKASYWDYATHHDDLEMYDRETLSRACAMEHTAQEAMLRHRAFEQGNASLLKELDVTRKLLQPVAQLEAMIMPQRYVDAPGAGGGGSGSASAGKPSGTGTPSAARPAASTSPALSRW